MKKALLIVIFAYLVSFSNNLTAQNKSQDTSQLSEIIIVRLVETQGSSVFDSEIIVYYGNDKFEKIELKNITMKGYPITNLEKIFIVINRLNENKYDLVTSYESGGAVNFIFKKKK